MKKLFFVLTVSMLVVFSGNLCAEESFALLRKQYQALSDEWKNSVSPERRNLARNSSDPRIRRELRFRQELLEDFVKTSREIQKVLDKMKLGDDLPLARHAENLRGGILLYEKAARNGQGGVKKGKDLPETVFRVIEADLEGLKEIGFTCENGVGTLSAEASAWPEFYQYRRHIRMLKLYLDVREKSAPVNMSIQRNDAFRELPDVAGSADRLSSRILHDFPDLRQEGLLLPVLTRKQLEDAKLLTSSAGLKNPAVSSKGSLRPDQVMPRIEKVLRKIESRIRASLREEAKEAEKPVREKRKTAAEPELPRTPPERVRREKDSNAVSGKKREVPPERRSEEELNRELVRLRQRILPDADKKTLTADELKQCLDLLSERERKQYETIRLRQIRNGSDHSRAPLEALKEMKELLTAPDAVFPSKQEKVLILKKAAEAGEQE